jgi:arylformamidase
MDLFKTRDHVSNFDDYVAEYKVMSEKTRGRLQNSLNVAYGPGANEKLDLFFPSAPVPGCPIHLFIHGGYWRMFAKDDFSFIADNVTACGAIAAVMDYDLMPAVRMETIIGQVRKALLWLHDNEAQIGGDATRLTVSGHSAGAHLATFTFSSDTSGPLPKAVVLLSGVYDLKPLQTSFLEPLIGLTDKEVDHFSPLSMQHASAPHVFLAYGDKETLPFAQQAQDFAQHLTGRGAKASATALIATDHMSAVRDLGRSETAIGKILQSAIGLS